MKSRVLPALNRRAFLRVSLCSLGTLLAAGLGWRFSQRALFPANTVRRKLGYLTLPPDPELRRFSEQYLASIGPQRAQLVGELATFAPLYALMGAVGIPSKFTKLLPEVEQHICFVFLMSTDFFRQGAKESLPLRYSLLYNPHLYPCQNPFARFELQG